MIKAVLLDLDNTLLEIDGESVFARSLEFIGPLAQNVAPSDTLLRQGLAALQASRNNADPTITFEEAFYHSLEQRTGSPQHTTSPLFQRFYGGQGNLAQLSSHLEPRRDSRELVQWLLDSEHQVVITPNVPLAPGIARQLVDLKMGLLENQHSNGITTIDGLHFAKPHPQYFEEILSRLGIGADNALVVSSHWEADIQPAAQLGISTFWVTSSNAKPQQPDGDLVPDGKGTLAQLLSLARDKNWFANLKRREKDWQACTGGLLGTLAAIDNLLRETDSALWTINPAVDEWSIRDAICHLRDHELEVDQMRLRLILGQDNPFISATNYSPLAHTHDYQFEDARDALDTFATNRMSTIDLIESVPASDWRRSARHSIFGPTTFGEMVTFMAEHDRIHLRQMRETLAMVSK